jgi:hypothetical protein
MPFVVCTPLNYVMGCQSAVGVSARKFAKVLVGKLQRFGIDHRPLPMKTGAWARKYVDEQNADLDTICRFNRCLSSVMVTVGHGR